ncbi:MAG: hypothetical protein ACKV1O_01510, partial [Saprospiraceae bacterium]
MILSDKYRFKRRRQEKRLLAIAGLLLFAAGLIYIIAQAVKSRQVSPNRVYCDAETVQGKQFKGQGGLFSNSASQSPDRARSGSFACKVPKGEGIQFGFGYEWLGAKAGELFTVSVWRFKNPGNEGSLVVRADNVLYFESNTPVEMDGQGWEKLEIR